MPQASHSVPVCMEFGGKFYPSRCLVYEARIGFYANPVCNLAYWSVTTIPT